MNNILSPRTLAKTSSTNTQESGSIQKFIFSHTLEVTIKMAPDTMHNTHTDTLPKLVIAKKEKYLIPFRDWLALRL